MARIISTEGFEVQQAADCKSALKKLEHTDTDVVLCDVKLPDGSGIELCKQIKEKYPAAEIIVLTAYGNIPDGVQAIKNGAFDYIVKGDDNDKIIPLLNRALEKAELSKRIKQLEKQLGAKHSFDAITGKSKAIIQALELAEKVAATDATVLLNGETGTGKEVFAQAIHQASSRASKNFVAINCSAFSKELLESEMFGHKAGAFTGAVKDRKGLFEEANQGTIFLDEIGEMPMELQDHFQAYQQKNRWESGTHHLYGPPATNRDPKRVAQQTTSSSSAPHKVDCWSGWYSPPNLFPVPDN